MRVITENSNNVSAKREEIKFRKKIDRKIHFHCQTFFSLLFSGKRKSYFNVFPPYKLKNVTQYKYLYEETGKFSILNFLKCCFQKVAVLKAMHTILYKCLNFKFEINFLACMSCT